MSTGIKAQRPNRLTEEETLTSFEDWRNSLIFYLNQDTNFSKCLKSDAVWEKSSGSAEHRGLASEDELLHLRNFLGVIASSSPPLHGDLIDDTKSLSEIFQQLRTYYQFAPSESTFIKFVNIKREIINGSPERPRYTFIYECGSSLETICFLNRVELRTMGKPLQLMNHFRPQLNGW